MKYWAYLAAKLGAAYLFLAGVWLAMNRLIPEPATFLKQRVSRFPQDLPWTFALLLFWLLIIGTGYLVVWDQRRRCRTCLRRLRMPVARGSWSMATLFSPPELESICPYGHGTFAEPETHNSTSQPPGWREHEDMWRELEELERKGR